MRYPAWVFDTRSIINEKEVKEQIKSLGIGKESVSFPIKH